MKYDFLDQTMLAKLENIPIEARSPMLGNVAGRHKSPARGSSVEFAEYRKYVQGDDTRRLDWKAYARSDRYYIKEFEADTNLRAYFVLDSSGSMNYHSADYESKLQVAKKIIASLAYLISSQGDAVGLSCINHKLHTEIPARSKPTHLQQIFNTLQKLKGRGETSLPSVLHDLAEKIQKRALIIVISDFFCDTKELEDALAHLHHRKHDVAVIHLMDKQEIEFNFQRPHRFLDLEGASAVITEPQLIANEYREIVQQFLKEVRTASYDINADYHLLNTTVDIESFLREFLVARLPKGK